MAKPRHCLTPTGSSLKIRRNVLVPVTAFGICFYYTIVSCICQEVFMQKRTIQANGSAPGKCQMIAPCIFVQNIV